MERFKYECPICGKSGVAFIGIVYRPLYMANWRDIDRFDIDCGECKTLIRFERLNNGLYYRSVEPLAAYVTNQRLTFLNNKGEVIGYDRIAHEVKIGNGVVEVVRLFDWFG